MMLIVANINPGKNESQLQKNVDEKEIRCYATYMDMYCRNFNNVAYSTAVNCSTASRNIKNNGL